MLRRIKQLFNDPIAPPPQGGWLARWWPRLVGGLLNAALLAFVVWVWSSNLGYPLWWAGKIIFPAGLPFLTLLLLAPVFTALTGFQRERARNTLDTLVLLPVDRARLVRARFLAEAGPWLILMVLALPFYFLMTWGLASEGVKAESFLMALINKPALLWYGFKDDWNIHIELLEGAGRLTWMLALGWLCDLGLVAFGVAWGLEASLLTRTALGAAIRGAIGTLAMVTVMSADLWLVLLLVKISRGGLFDGEWLFNAIAAVMFVLRPLAAWWLYRRMVRNFDAYALGEKSG